MKKFLHFSNKVISARKYTEESVDPANGKIYLP